MNRHEDNRSELDYWVDMWDEIQSQEGHLDTKQPDSDDLNVYTPKNSDGHTDEFLDYYGSDELFQEEKAPINPIHPDSIGPDNEGPEPAWVSEKLLSEIEKLKNRLFAIENNMAKLGQNNKPSEKVRDFDGDDKKMMDQINSIKKQIEDVSSKLGV